MTAITWLLLGIVLILAWCYSRWKLSYWSKKGVPTMPYLTFLGHAHKILIPEKRFAFENEAYRKYGESKFCGIYGFHKPDLLVFDPELLKYIYIKDFDYFMDRHINKLQSKKDKVMANMLNMKTGEEWKKLRAIISPTFTSGKIKGMFSTVCKKADALVSFCLKECQKEPSIDMKYNFGRFTMDTIAACAFGIECNSLVDEKPIFAEKVEEMFKVNPSMILKFLLINIFPKVAAALDVRFSVETTDFFTEVATETLEERKKGNRRGDFLDLLLEAGVPNSGEKFEGDQSLKHKQALDDLTIISQSVLFLVSGYDTTASTLAFTSFMLAKNPKVQERLRQELNEMVEQHGDITYQGIMEAKYLDACVNETLRLYPPALFVERLCKNDYKLPGTDVLIEAGTIVTTPIKALHMDPKYWPEPEVYRPERFLPENMHNIQSFTHVPFGMGPRNCIAMRFALMEVKVGLAKMVLASQFEVDSNFKIRIDYGFGILRPGNGLRVTLKPLKEE